MTRTRGYDNRPATLEHAPNFDSGVIDEPLIAFGGQHKHVDPKTGLSLYGPYSLVGQDHATLRNITVGIVGPAGMIADAEAWLQACTGIIVNDGAQPFLYPHFPGCNANEPFQCVLTFGDTWRESIKEGALKTAVALPEGRRLSAVVALYAKALEVLAAREPRPDVVLCCIPQLVIDSCTVKMRRPDTCT